MPFYGVYKGAPNQGVVHDNWGATEKAMRGVAGVRVKRYSKKSDAELFAASGDYSIETAVPSIHPTEVLEVYTDGSYTSSNQRAGVGVHFPEYPALDVSERFTVAPITSQRAELYAAIRAMQVIKSQTWPATKKIIYVYTDSRYVYGCAFEWAPHWKVTNFRNGTIKNQDLITQLWQEMETLPLAVRWQWVRSHNGTPGNETADKLATEGGKKNQPPVYHFSLTRAVGQFKQ
jgi:ribonuclease HI